MFSDFFSRPPSIIKPPTSSFPGCMNALVQRIQVRAVHRISSDGPVSSRLPTSWPEFNSPTRPSLLHHFHVFNETRFYVWIIMLNETFYNTFLCLERWIWSTESILQHFRDVLSKLFFWCFWTFRNFRWKFEKPLNCPSTIFNFYFEIQNFHEKMSYRHERKCVWSAILHSLRHNLFRLHSTRRKKYFWIFVKGGV